MLKFTAQAEEDLKRARLNGRVTLFNTNKGNAILSYRDGKYRIVELSSRLANGDRLIHYLGRKAGAVEWLVSNYQEGV